MRALPLLLIVSLIGTFSPKAQADALQDTFKAQIEAALKHDDRDKRKTAVKSLFYRDGLDDWSKKLVDRTIKHLVDQRGNDITFAPLHPRFQKKRVVNGYEYRPNLEALGYVVFASPKARKGNSIKAPYGLHPDGQRYQFPITVRKLVNPDSSPDKQLQIMTIGIANPPVTFKGWCNITLSDKSVRRIRLDDRRRGNQTRVVRGQSIEQCSVTNTAGRGALILRLSENRKKIFDRRIEAPETTITYRR